MVIRYMRKLEPMGQNQRIWINAVVMTQMAKAIITMLIARVRMRSSAVIKGKLAVTRHRPTRYVMRAKVRAVARRLAANNMTYI